MSFGKAKKQNNKIHIGSRAFDVFLIVFMIIVAIIFLYPFLNVIATSLSSNRMITTGQVTFFPNDMNFSSYHKLFSGLIFLVIMFAPNTRAKQMTEINRFTAVAYENLPSTIPFW